MSSKSTYVILSYTVSKLVRFLRHSVQPEINMAAETGNANHSINQSLLHQKAAQKHSEIIATMTDKIEISNVT